jgi:hypothetical protein
MLISLDAMCEYVSCPPRCSYPFSDHHSVASLPSIELNPATTAFRKLPLPFSGSRLIGGEDKVETD